MTIFYRSKTPQAPSFLHKPKRKQAYDYYIFFMGDAKSLPKNDDYKKLDKDYEFAVIGDNKPIARRVFEYDSIMFVEARDGSEIAIYPVTDRQGNTYNIPCFYINDSCNISMPVVFENGEVIRKATFEQDKLIKSLEVIKRLIEENEPITLEVGAKLASLILSYSYNCSEEEFLIHGLLDDFLIMRVILASLGYYYDSEQ